MLVYFHIDEVARDSIVASDLKQEITKIGGRLVYGNRFSTAHILKYINVFDVVILPSLQHYVSAFPDATNLPDNIFILQTEAVGQATGTLRRMHAKYFGNDPEICRPWHRCVAGFLLWGPAHVDAFKNDYSEYLPRVRVVGHPRFASAYKKTKVEYSRKKKRIGFVSRFNLLMPFDSRTPFMTVKFGMKSGKDIHPKYENSPDRNIEDLFYTEVIDIRVMLEVIMLLDKNKYDICVRPHPRENRMGWIDLARKINVDMTISQWDEPFSHWLEDVDLVVTPPSTSLYDIYYGGKQAIVIDQIVPKRADHILTESDDKNQILDGMCRPKSIEELLNIIDSGSIPNDQKIINKCLGEQVAADMACESIRSIVKVLPVQSPSRLSGASKQRSS